jgi:hypothetical protein
MGELILCTEFIHVENEDTHNTNARSGKFTVLHDGEIANQIEKVINKCLTHFGQYLSLNTKYEFSRVLYIEFIVDKYEPLSSGSYIDLPKWIKNKKACINVQNEDNRCILYSIEALNNPPLQDAQRPLKYDLTEYNTFNIRFPTPLEDIPTLEEQLDCTINIYRPIEGQKIQCIRAIRYERNKHYNILLIQDHALNYREGNYHYVAIKNLSRLIRSQQTKHKSKMHFCLKCFQHKKTLEDLETHKDLCYTNTTVDIMPSIQNRYKKFKNFNRSLKIPYVISADMETLISKNNNDSVTTESTQFDKRESACTVKTAKHIPSGFALTVKSPTDNELHNKAILYRGEDCIPRFQEELEKLAKSIHKKLKTNYPIDMTNEDEDLFQATNICHICHTEIMPNETKCRDHDHLKETNNYRGASHQSCNINYKYPKFIPVFFHNLSGFDLHLFIKYFASKYDVTIIPKNDENYISFSIKVKVDEWKLKKDSCYCTKCKISQPNNCTNCNRCNQKLKVCKTGDLREVFMELRFLDSFRFMGTSLSKLVENLLEVNTGFCPTCKCMQSVENINFLKRKSDKTRLVMQGSCEKCTSRILKVPNLKHFDGFRTNFGDNWHLMLRKGIYPYEYMDTWGKFEESSLPSISKFYSSLNDKNVTKNDYKHALDVFEKFKMKNLGDFHDKYLLSDTLLLAAVIEGFRDVCMKNYKLDPCYYYSAPGLSDDAAFKLTKAEIELLTDYDMYLMIESGIRGGISMAPGRYAKANNTYIVEKGKILKLSEKDAILKGIFVENLPESYIVYLDCNNLYGKAMCEYLPTGMYSWLTQEEINDIKIADFKADSDIGYILDVNISIPPSKHDYFKDFPLAPRNEVPDRVELSSYQNQLITQGVGKIPTNKKLLCTLNTKKNYIIHYMNLKQYLDLGLELISINRVIKFNQSPWLKPYIDQNTQLRKDSKNDFEKDFFKLMNNSEFGKQMESVRKRCDVHIVSDYEQFRKKQKDPSFSHRFILDENLVLINMKKKIVKLNKPIIGGFCILEISKYIMYNYYYTHLKDNFGVKVKLLYIDTDGIFINVECKDFYEFMKKNINFYDTSNFPNNHPTGISQKNAREPGLFKDELGGKIIRRFVALRSKLYAYETDEMTGIRSKKVCKGIKKNVIQNKLKFDDYLGALNDNTINYQDQHLLRSFKHEIYSITQCKKAISPWDDKRKLLDKHNTVPYGYIPPNLNSSHKF